MNASRSILSFSRDLEFATETELSKRMGCERDLWLRAVVKELIDNSLDACEGAGISPVITIAPDFRNRVSCTDNGPGMTPELVERLCVRSERTSTREAYAAPDRGSQGNALATLLALPFGFGLDEAITTITSRGVEHTITLRVDRLAQRINLERIERPVPDAPGTIVTMDWPEPIAVADVSAIVYQHALLNQHARFVLRDPAGNEQWAAGPSAAIAKWTPQQPIPVHWYSLERFTHRVLLEIRRDPEITVAQFLSGFRGLTGSVKRSEVAEAADLSYRPLAALLDTIGTTLDPYRTQALLGAMQAASRPPKHAALGAAGRAAFEMWVGNLATSNPDQSRSGDRPFLAYSIVDGVVDDAIPYRWELGICHLPGLDDERQLLTGMNFSPAIEPERLIDDVMDEVGWQLNADQPVALFMHRITPARASLDYGKTILGIGASEAMTVAEALEKIAKPWVKHATALDRGKKPTLPNTPKPDRSTIKAAVAAVLPECYVIASTGGRYPTSPRQLYYVVRPKVLALTGRAELDYGYFGADLLPRYLQDNAKTVKGWRIYFKARGALREPHTDVSIPLGTQEVAGYIRGWLSGHTGRFGIEAPDWAPETRGARNRFGALIIVEKDGIADLLALAGVGERFDVAIVGNEGQSVEAELRLADALGVPVFTLHDFDRTGLTIGENLRTGTWRHRYENDFPVIEIGLRLDQVAGLEREPITAANRRSVSNDRLRECGATAAEIKFLHGHRVELNALTTEQLVVMVEAALVEHGIQKVIPAADDLADAWRSAQAHAEVAEAIETANAAAVERWQDAEAPEDLMELVREALAAAPGLSWDTVLRAIVETKPPAFEGRR